MIVAAWFLMSSVIVLSSIGFCVMIYRAAGKKEAKK